MSNSSIVLPAPEEYRLAVQALQKGGIVAYPTETFYGLAVDPENKEALSTLYRLKQRSPEKPFPLIVPDLANLSSYVDEFPGASNILMDKFWPGPLTLIFQASDNSLPFVNKKDHSLAVRISSHIVASTLCRFFGRAITASSANISVDKRWTMQLQSESYGETGLPMFWMEATRPASDLLQSFAVKA